MAALFAKRLKRLVITASVTREKRLAGLGQGIDAVFSPGI
jgi:hypothetical protein